MSNNNKLWKILKVLFFICGISLLVISTIKCISKKCNKKYIDCCEYNKDLDCVNDDQIKNETESV